MAKGRSSAVSVEASNAQVARKSQILGLPTEIVLHFLAFLLVPDDGYPVVLRSASVHRWRKEISGLVNIGCTQSHPA